MFADRTLPAFGVTEGMFKTVLDAIGTILIAFGIVNNPTDKENL